MHGDFTSTAVFNRMGTIQKQGFVFVTQAHFGAQGDVFGQSRAHGLYDVLYSLWFSQQHRATLMAVYRGGWATEIDVDFLGAVLQCFQGIERHIFRI